MPYDSPYWTLAEAIVWLGTGDSARLNALDPVERNSTLRLRFPAGRRKTGMSGRDYKAAVATLRADVLAKRVTLWGVVMERGVREIIPASVGLNMELFDSLGEPGPTRYWLQQGLKIVSNSSMKVGETIGVAFVVGGRTIRTWADVKIERDAALRAWERTKREFSSEVVPPEVLLWADEMAKGGETITQALMEEKARRQYRKAPPVKSFVSVNAPKVVKAKKISITSRGAGAAIAEELEELWSKEGYEPLAVGTVARYVRTWVAGERQKHNKTGNG